MKFYAIREGMDEDDEKLDSEKSEKSEKITYPIKLHRPLYDALRKKLKDERGITMHRFFIESAANYVGFDLKESNLNGYSQSGKRPPTGNRKKPFVLLSPTGERFEGVNLAKFVRDNRELFGQAERPAAAVYSSLKSSRRQGSPWFGWRFLE
jgi:hypothetical protein